MGQMSGIWWSAAHSNSGILLARFFKEHKIFLDYDLILLPGSSPICSSQWLSALLPGQFLFIIQLNLVISEEGIEERTFVCAWTACLLLSEAMHLYKAVIHLKWSQSRLIHVGGSLDSASLFITLLFICLIPVISMCKPAHSQCLFFLI